MRRGRLLIFLLALALVVAGGEGLALWNEQNVKITSISATKVASGTEVTIMGNAPLLYSYYVPAATPDQLLVDFPNTLPAEIPLKMEPNTPEVKRIEVEKVSTKEMELTRVKIHFAQPCQFEVRDGGKELRIFVRLKPGEPVTKKEVKPQEVAKPVIKKKEKEVPSAPPPLKKEVTGAGQARNVNKIIARKVDDTVVVSVLGNGRFKFNKFELSNPPRLVLDIEAVKKLSRDIIKVDSPLLSRVRSSQFKSQPVPITRVVLDLGKATSYEIIPEANVLKVLLSPLPPGKKVAVLRKEAEKPVVPPPKKEKKTEVVPPKRVEKEKLVKKKVVPTKIAPPKEEKVALPAVAKKPLAEKKVISRPTAPSVSEKVAPKEEKKPSELISLKFRDADIRDVIRLFADFTGKNFVIDPGVSGRVTVVLNDVPWEKALDIILRNNDLAKVEEEGVYWIATAAKIKAREDAQRALEESRKLSAPLTTATQRISYAKARELEPIVRQNLTKRGTVIVDERTNTLIISDIEGKVSEIVNLIKSLDVPTKQVLISARIVESTQEFIQRLGVQWGLKAVGDAAHGNTTQFVFPNTYVVQGATGISSQISDYKVPYAVNLPITPTAGIGISFGNILNSFRLDAQLLVAEQTGEIRVLSRPRVATQSNKQAKIESGQVLPYQTYTEMMGAITQFLTATLSLAVTPQITAENTVMMDIEIKNDTVGISYPGVHGSLLPSKATQSATSSILVANGETAVIGGIATLRTEITRGRVPLFHRIPILGWLFKNKDEKQQNKELVIFITPSILNP